jgi:hypothetical protein
MTNKEIVAKMSKIVAKRMVTFWPISTSGVLPPTHVHHGNISGIDKSLAPQKNPK